MLDEVRLLSAGFCLHPEAMTRRGAGWQPCRFPSGFALIRHPSCGVVLYDTGYSERFHDETRTFPGLLYARLTPVHLAETQTARRQLAASGIEPSEVREIIVSHFHADHVAGLRDFPAARVRCSRAAWESVRGARGMRAVLKGFLPGLMPPDIEARLAFVEDARAVSLPPGLDEFGAGRDLFGDGSVVAVDLPGHAPGHIGLLLAAPGPSPVLLVGDAAWSRRAIEAFEPPPRITTALLGSTRAYRTTLARLGVLRCSMPHLSIVPSHCSQTLEFASGG